MNKKYLAAAAPLLALIASGAHAQDVGTDIEAPVLEEMTIIGYRGGATHVPGGATVINTQDILAFNQSDIQRILRQVPGVSVQVEDGFGLRPNLSIRGTASERSARITLLEDGVLIAPAPYSAPAAYYFPTAGRLAGVEVLKGPAAITQGPYTVGGAINLLSTPIPESRSGLLNLQGGDDATGRLHAYYGEDAGRFGWLVETHQWRSDGFQELDTGGDTGLEKQDYMVKLRLRNDEGSAVRQQLDLKLQYAEESSDQSYLGLTDADFDANPLRRYTASAFDNIDTDHTQVMLRHRLDTDGGFSLTTTAYYNDFARDWFKTEELDITGSPDAQTFNGVSWFQVVQAVNQGLGLGPASAQDLADILGGGDTDDGAIQVRSNAREYYAYGLQVDARWDLDLGSTQHRLTASMRRHTDHEERLQRNSTYTQLDGELILDDLGLLGNAGNREQDADAWALYVRDEITFGAVTLSPGLRYERIEQERVEYETRSGFTDDPSSREVSNVREIRGNNTDVFIPGIGATVDIGQRWVGYGGVHRGFSAPGNAAGVDPEESTNFELGARFAAGRTVADIGLFLTDYDNLVGTCTASSGLDCEVGDAFNGDAATVAGVELTASHSFELNRRLRIPLSLTYTYIDGQFDSDIADTDFFGEVTAGDPLPYISEHQGLLRVGLEGADWGLYASYNFTGEACVRASCGPFEATQASSIFDASAFWVATDRITLTATVENLTDDAVIVARTPYGARPNKARTAVLGIRVGL
ncbi:MAG: TonB-dependent receptor [Pseudomonadota bacterium]